MGLRNCADHRHGRTQDQAEIVGNLPPSLASVSRVGITPRQLLDLQWRASHQQLRPGFLLATEVK